MPLIWVELRGVEPRTSQHAMQCKQCSCLGFNRSDQDLQCTGVSVSACKPVRVGCPLGCPLVVALSVFEPFVVGLRRGGTDTLAE